MQEISRVRTREFYKNTYQCKLTNGSFSVDKALQLQVFITMLVKPDEKQV